MLITIIPATGFLRGRSALANMLASWTALYRRYPEQKWHQLTMWILAPIHHALSFSWYECKIQLGLEYPDLEQTISPKLDKLTMLVMGLCVPAGGSLLNIHLSSFENLLSYETTGNSDITSELTNTFLYGPNSPFLWNLPSRNTGAACNNQCAKQRECKMMDRVSRH